MEPWLKELERQGLLDSAAGGEPDLDAIAARVAALPASDANAALLQRLAASAPKKLAKEARRLLHLWRSRGLVAAQPPPSGQTWRLENRPNSLAALLSHIDGNGDRFVIYGFSRPSTPYAVLIAIGNDAAGLTRAEVYEPPNKRAFRTLLQTVQESEGLTWVEADPAYVRALLQHFYRLSRAHRGAVPRDFELYRQALGPEVPLPPPPIYERLAAAEVAASRAFLLTGSGELLDEDEMLDWYLEGPVVEEAVAKLKARQTSPLIVSEMAEREMAERIKGELLQNAFTSDFRQLFARRLEEMAFVFWETGRSVRARQAVALAQALQEGTSLTLIPFFQKLVSRSLAVALEAGEKAPGRRSRIGLFLPDLRERLLVP